MNCSSKKLQMLLLFCCDNFNFLAFRDVILSLLDGSLVLNHRHNRLVMAVHHRLVIQGGGFVLYAGGEELEELKHAGDDRCWWVAHTGLVAASSTHSDFKMQR